MEIQITQLSSADLSCAGDLAHILIAAWRSGFRGILPDAVIGQYTQFAPCADMFRQVLASGEGNLYLAQQKGQPVGLLYWVPEENCARIEALLTIPDVWGQGVAATLMAHTLKHTSAYPVVTVWPFVRNHRARRFYEKHGFSPSGRSRMGDAEEMEYCYHHKGKV